MVESIDAWWARRQRSKGMPVPYPIGTYRDDWQRYPALIRQYHPDLNHGITLTQIPPAAEVYLTWQCDAGHLFVATPAEQRDRPGRVRRRSSWCPTCSAAALPGVVGPSRHDEQKTVLRAPSTSGARGRRAARAPSPSLRAVGEAFHSPLAPQPSSAAEGRLRAALADRLDVDLTPNAVVVGRPFFDRLEVWPDIVIAELRVAIEYDTVGRFGLEHVGRREAVDRRKDRLLREARWEVVRLRSAPLRMLGPHDLVITAVSADAVDRLVETLRVICGDLLVNAYARAG
ncbi:zinc-ribbon domain-containing protein [Subtercola sp. YIM 133946]|uniref:zinc-ribbon domain-containing protein n=1 Tax=Subtercola sp. YIM 133946 TaxID=3118909 RepID=UPI002F92B9D4